MPQEMFCVPSEPAVRLTVKLSVVGESCGSLAFALKLPTGEKPKTPFGSLCAAIVTVRFAALGLTVTIPDEVDRMKMYWVSNCGVLSF